MSILQLYVDGSWKPKLPDYAGWAFLCYLVTPEPIGYIGTSHLVARENGLIKCKSRQIDGELIATIEALRFVQETYPKVSKIELYFDYIGIQMWAIGLWKARSEIAIEYVKALDSLEEILDKVTFIKVNSHAGESDGNDLVDKLANEAVDNFIDP
jgi:ribonuclease HI